MAMINELTDEEILDFLMTSEFEEEYKPEEFKYLLYKFRYFHRILKGRYDLSLTDLEALTKRSTDVIEEKERIITDLLTKNAEMQNTIDSLKNRKLSLRERISGKIIEKTDEN